MRLLPFVLTLLVALPAGAQESGGGVPEPRSLVVDVGGALVGLGGYAYPRIPLRGTSDNEFHLHGQGAAFKVHVDFPANELDWRVGLNGALPGYFGLSGTVGVRKDLSIWDNPRLITRGGGGVELMVAGGAKGFNMLVPVFKVEGEMALEVVAVPDKFQVGAVLDLAARYGLPLGVGFDLGTYLRANFFF